MTKHYHDAKARNLPALEIGQPVYVQNHNNTEKSRTPGKIERSLTDRSYIVNANNGNASFRRNRVDIKPRAENSVSTDSDIPRITADTTQ